MLEEARLDPPRRFAAGQYALLTMSVTPSHVAFFQNLEELGTIPLPRQLTDCYNHGLGIELGASGLELGVVQYHPTALSKAGIEELFFAGDILEHVSTGSQPAVFKVSEIESLVSV